MITIQPAALADFAGAILAAAGAPGDIAGRMAQSLVGANLAGHDSHGVIRIPQYLAEIERGQVDPAARPEVVREGPAWALVDGKWAFGQETARFAMEQAIQRAGPMGVGFASAVHCNHIGRVGQWVEQAAAAEMVGAAGVAITGGTATRVAPFGGAAGVLSTNPLAIAAPRTEGPPLLLDFATSSVAEGKVRVAREKGVPLPEGCILDKNGHPTSDPNALYDGGVLLPFGGHKGYALAMMIEVLGIAVGGADAAKGDHPGSCHGAFCLAINPAVFRSIDGFQASVESLVERVKSVPPAPGFEEVLLPGEPEARTRAEREGAISLAPVTWQAVVEAGARLGVSAPAVAES